MLNFQWKIYKKLVRASWVVFGFGKEFLRFLCMMPVRIALLESFLLLDHLFFPGFSRTSVVAPLFIIGHPRSGTTFLHRLLTSTGQWGAFRYWELLVPSLTARSLVGPIVRWMIRRGRDVYYPASVGHELRLNSVEEDELLFLHKLNTQFLAVTTPWGLGDEDFGEVVFGDAQPEKIRRRTMAFYKACLQRQLFITRTARMACNANYSALRLRSLLETFPDAKVLYVVRSPLETMPSHLTLHRNMFHHTFGADRVPPERLRRYAKKRYKYNVAFYHYMESLFSAGVLHSGNCLVIRYEELKQDVVGVGQAIARFTGCPLEPALERAFKEAAESQSRYRPPHRNASLEAFGFSEADILRDLGFVFEKYNFDGRKENRA